ncbi:MAG: Dam family site-specific DNA-(adenine-N6)-methyltransferase [Dehalococcoidia bacterium]|nr:Dam family site-specific DNA-(adenine-N6)-methyltransferase [Dehalococcoidia bacterium]
MAKPFLKWAGGKGKLAPHIAERAPERIARYHEPFLGGGAVFFALQERGLVGEASLADRNGDLMATYEAVRDDVEGVIGALGELSKQYLAREPSQRGLYYYEVRDRRRPRRAARKAARLLFLNKTCYNGLYRVNNRGHFNVPHGRYVRPAILDEGRLREASASLAGIELRAEDFAEACGRAKAGDFVYLDPPYRPLSATSAFTKYTSADFGFADQERLRDAFDELTNRGVAALLSNSSHPDIHELYRDYEQDLVPMGRAINSNGKGRAPIDELLVSNLSLVEGGVSGAAPARSRA